MLRFYFDEDSAQHRLVSALRSHSIDVTTFLDSGMSARDDESQLIFAAAQGRVLVSGNARDFASLHCDWMGQGRSHFGILIIPRQRYSTGEPSANVAPDVVRIRPGEWNLLPVELLSLRGEEVAASFNSIVWSVLSVSEKPSSYPDWGAKSHRIHSIKSSDVRKS